MDAPTDTSIPSEMPFAWQCPECAGTGTIQVRFPIAPDHLAEMVWEKHHEVERRRHCMCPGHYMKFWPIKT
jgi:hypothetical protein